MKKELLTAIIHILALVAKDEDVTADERDAVENFLLQNLRSSEAKQYMQLFDKIAAQNIQNKIEQDKEEISKLAKILNKELTQTQKIIVLVNLMELIAADGIITETENELLYHTSKRFNIHQEAVTLIKSFTIRRKKESLDSKYTLFIDSIKDAQYRQSKHLYCEGLQGYIVVLKIPVYDVYFIKHIEKDHVYLNGNMLPANKAINFSVGSVIKTHSGAAIYHSDVLQVFLRRRQGNSITLQVENVSYRFKGGHKYGIRHINMQEESGNLVAIMGSSGAGKSTLLNVLNGLDAPTEGRVLINGIDIYKDRKKIEGLVGFVPQEDLLMEDLTVFENLYYAGKLCFGELESREIRDKVNQTLQKVGLYEIRHLRVGSPLQKMISGGQRKRLNIALELIRKPPVLFIDEPTSGLSSRDSERIMDLLKEISHKGNLIITVIHQPSSDIFKMFNRLVILDVGGYQVYYGNPVQALVYFKEIIDAIDKEHGQCIECGNVNSEQIFSILETKIIDEYGRETDKRKVLPPSWHDWYKRKIYRSAPVNSQPLPARNFHIANRLKQFFTFTQRDVKSKLANTQYLAINLLEPPLLAAILAYLARYASVGKIYTFAENINIPIFFFMSIIVALFMGLTVSAEEIFKDRKILKREAFLHLSRMSYLGSKLFTLFVLSSIQTLTYVLIGDLILDIDEITLSYWLVLFSISCFGNVLGLNISSSFNSVVTIYIMVPLMLIPQLVLSGLVVEFDEVHPALQEPKRVPLVGELMASRWAFEAIAVTQFKDNPIGKQFYEYDKKLALAEYHTVYWYPTMMRCLEEVYTLANRRNENPKAFNHRLRFFRNEIDKKLKIYGYKQLPVWENLKSGIFDNYTYSVCQDFLETIKVIYVGAHKQANQAKDAYIKSITKTQTSRDHYLKQKSKYENKRLNKVIKGLNSSERIIETKNELIQKVYPIYSQAVPSSLLDFRTRMYYPQKHIFGRYVDTLYFNVCFIWLMTMTLIATLYFDILKHILFFFGGILHIRRKDPTK